MLAKARVDSARSLAGAWASKPTLLQQELLLWLGKSQHRALQQLWPKLLQQAAAAAAQTA